MAQPQTPEVRSKALGKPAKDLENTENSDEGELDSAQSSDAWDGKFRFGALSTFYSSYLLGGEFRYLIPALAVPSPSSADIDRLRSDVEKVVEKFQTATDAQFIAAFKGQSTTPNVGCMTRNIYDVRRSILNLTGNAKFVAAMPRHRDLADLDDILRRSDREFQSQVQYNAHRGLYNEGLGVPRNTVASVVNAYVAGIRSVEFDVLETHHTDNQPATNVIIHDVNVNRLTASFDGSAVTVGRWAFDDLLELPIDMLNPIGASPTAIKTSLAGLMTTTDFLKTTLAVTRGMALYADARNYAPVSLMKLLVDAGGRHSEFNDHVVTKIYPFELSGGCFDLVSEYAKRYKAGDISASLEELRALAPNFLLAIGGINTQATERVLQSNARDTIEPFGAYKFSWDIYSKIKSHLPYVSEAHGAKWNVDPSSKGELFKLRELEVIEARTYLALRWIVDFYAIARVRVIQVPLLPSLKSISEHLNSKEWEAMVGKGRNLSNANVSAITDNIIAFFQYLKSPASKEFDELTVLGPDGAHHLHDLCGTTGWGSSDRYPDFGICNWNHSTSLPSGDADTWSEMQHYYYGMPSTVVTYKGSYYNDKLRNSAAIEELIDSFKNYQLPFCYLTTDLPEDLRAKSMGSIISGAIKYRIGGMIDRSISEPHGVKVLNPKTFVIPPWGGRLFGAARDKAPQLFNELNESFAKLSGDLTALRRVRDVLQASDQDWAGVRRVIVEEEALRELGITAAYCVDQPDHERVVVALKQIDEDMALLSRHLNEISDACFAQFSVRLDGSNPAKPVPNGLAIAQREHPEWY